MQPFKFAFPFAVWVLRLSILLMVYMIFFGTFRAFETNNVEFWIACGFGLFAVLLFVGGFLKSHNLTVISALILALACGYKVFMHFVFDQGSIVAVYGVFGAISVYFITAGNRKK